MLAVVAIGILIWGLSFIKGKNLFDKQITIYTEYEDVAGLATSAPVWHRGMPVGTVSRMYFKPEDGRKIVVEINIEKPVPMPKNGIAVIKQSSLIGGKIIELIFDVPCTNGDCVEDGDHVKGIVYGLLGSVVPKQELDGYLENLGASVGGVMDTLNAKIKDEDPNNRLGKSLREIEASVVALRMTVNNLNSVLASTNKSLPGILGNVDAVTLALRQQSSNLQGIIANTRGITSKLNSGQLDSTIASINSTLTDTRSAIVSLKSTLDATGGAVKNLDGILANANAGKGTLGKLLASDSLYNKIDVLLQNIDTLSSDIRQKPYRYIPLKSRRKVKRYDRLDAEKN